MAELPKSLKSFWAKTGLEDNKAQGLSLAQHMLDSATVARYLWRNWVSEGSKNLLAQKLSLTSEDTEAFVAWVVGTHDIGKASPEFAGQLDSRNDQELLVYRQRIEDCGYTFPMDLTNVQGRCPHSQYSQSIITAWLQNLAEDDECEVAQSIAHISGAHHGIPGQYVKSPNGDRYDEQLLAYVTQQEDYDNWAVAWDQLLTFIAEEMGAGQSIMRLLNGKSLAPEVQFFLTGLTIMSDWIASNPDFFPYEEGQDQNNRMHSGFEALNLSNPWKPENLDGLTPEQIYSQRFGWGDDLILRPMQKTVVEAARSLTDGGLICIEAPMGQGKTEAGLVAAEILAHQAGKNGIMFAAPTQATANALFDRIDDWTQKAAAQSETVSMYLAHSKNQLKKEFADKRFTNVRTYESHEKELGIANVIAHQWFSKKKGILSSFVVGTVDQVLMMALASRHVMLRHLGLSEKVVVIDEVHAYDAYMNVYLENALKWLGRMKVPVILMSATLPAAARQKLMKAYSREFNPIEGIKAKRQRAAAEAAHVSAEIDLSYPVIHTVSSAQHGVPQKWDIEQPTEQKPFSLRAIDDSYVELDRVLSPVETEGGCVAIICNTVGRAQEVYEHLQNTFSSDELILVHSRFISLDRVNQETELVEKLGKKSRRGRGRPHRFIVVGTQVIEQSLDVDFDVMITDHAPVDLVLQRIGRLHRHERDGERPAPFERPICYVRGVDELGAENSTPVFSSVAELIYDKAILLSSYAQLMPFFEGDALHIPADISRTVQGAYSEEPFLPESWMEAWDEAIAERRRKAVESEKKAGGYSMNPNDKKMMFDFFEKVALSSKDADEVIAQAKVRDTEDTLEVIVVQSDDASTYRPLHTDYADAVFERDALEKPDWKLANVLAGSTIRLPYQFADKGWSSENNPLDKALSELEEDMFSAWQKHYLLKGQLALVLDQNCERVLAGKKIRYSRELGLQVLNDEIA
ncbi:CRISPR-associated helicase Cas3' [Rothia terrae]|uniref:CRISPR-associated helicase Cas3' n=1 Tax=Rothia terrae TaxID=396015 RepID=UPI0028828678|nr:CRISPR-associated helicase Cas3' [Rothia terrae]MDT0189639.1 CRISPR-associated helicase Cas3' [Rothia terrae]